MASDDDGSMIIDMEMSLSTDPNVTDFLFQNWNATTGSELFLMCLAMATLAFVVEAIKTVQDFWATKQKLSRRSNAVIDRQALLPDYPGSNLSRMSPCQHLAQTCVMALQVTVGYFLMLAVMSYNVWIILTVCASSTVAYFLFAMVRHSVRWSMYKNLHADNVVDEILRSVSS